MRSGSNQEAILDKQDTSQLNKFQAVELTLTHDQYAIIQHYLPKGYSLLEKKLGKREKGFGHKYPDNEVSIWSSRTSLAFQAASKIQKMTKAGPKETG